MPVEKPVAPTLILLTLTTLLTAAPLPARRPPAEVVAENPDGNVPAPDVPADDPLYGELLPYPPPAVVRSWLTFQQDRIDYLKGRLVSGFDGHRKAELTSALWDQKRHWKLWDDLDSAQNPGVDLGWRQECLARVKKAGLPQPVDLTTFDGGY